MSEMDQDEIDRLLADALGGDVDAGEDDSGAQSQDDIDALIAAAASGESLPDAGEENPEPVAEEEGAQSQDDIDALINAANDTTPAEATEAPAEEAAEESGPMGQDDINALIDAASDAPAEESAAQEEAADEGPMGQDDINALIDAASDTPTEEAPAAEAEDEGSMGQDDINALLSAAEDEAAEEMINEEDSLLDAQPIDTSGAMDQDDINALINAEAAEAAQSSETAEEIITEETPITEEEGEAAVDAGIEEELTASLESDSLADEFDDITAGAADLQVDLNTEAPPPPPPPPAPMAPPPQMQPPPVQQVRTMTAPQLTDEQLATIQESLSLSGSSGEVENLAGQMSGLLGQLSERARRFQAAWLTSDQESREIRHQLNLTEQKVHILLSEKDSYKMEIDTLRKQYSQIEGEKLASTEAHRTELASLELQLREQESRNNMLSSEVRALKEELERARNESTGSDLESRRARFENERISGELVSERQERQRLQRALENREKELQAMQAQSAGHASTLFLDELHRLVRRLESELDVRTSSAHEALSVLDRLEFSPEQQMYAATLRAALSSASGITPDENDALKSLDKQAEFGNETLEPAPAPGPDTFLQAIERYDFTKASGIASASMRSGEKAPLEFIKEIHSADCLRRPEMSEHLDDLSAMLRGIKTLQEASDRARGKEGENTEKMFVMMFDFLHTLVRMKLISRATPTIWDLFLELRGRFSFLTSDRQWREYRDRLICSTEAVG